MADGFTKKVKIDILKNQGRRSIRHLSASIFTNLMQFDIKNRLKSEKGGCVIGENALLFMLVCMSLDTIWLLTMKK